MSVVSLSPVDSAPGRSPYSPLLKGGTPNSSGTSPSPSPLSSCSPSAQSFAQAQAQAWVNDRVSRALHLLKEVKLRRRGGSTLPPPSAPVHSPSVRLRCEFDGCITSSVNTAGVTLPATLSTDKGQALGTSIGVASSGAAFMTPTSMIKPHRRKRCRRSLGTTASPSAFAYVSRDVHEGVGEAPRARKFARSSAE